MRKFLSGVRPGIVVAIILLMPAVTVARSDTTRKLQHCVHRLTEYLGTGRVSESWRRYLMLGALETQSAKGERADIVVLQQIYERFSRNVPTLQHPAFKDVRTALQRQIRHLSAASVPDLSLAIAQAHHEFRPITHAQLEYYRNSAAYEAQVLKQYYRWRRPSRERAEAYYELQLDELTQFLKSLTFEMPPSVSPAGLADEIQRLEKELQEFDEVQQPGQQRQFLEQRIDSLTEQRQQILQQDRDRLRRRADVLRELRRYTLAFDGATDKYGDAYFASCNSALQQFVRVYFYGTDADLRSGFQRQIEVLANEIHALNDPNQRESAAKIGNALGWLESALQVPTLVTAIRARHSLPNIYVSVSEGFINRVGSQPVQDRRPVNEVILGRLMRGVANTFGRVRMELINDPNQAHVSIHLLSTMYSDTYTKQGRITAFSGSTGQLEARRSIFANVGGLYESVVQGAAYLQSTFRGTNKKLRLINRIATKQYLKDKAQAEAIATRRTEGRFIPQFESQTGQAIANAKSRFAEMFDKTKLFASKLPELYLRTTNDHFWAVGHKSSLFDLAAPYPPQAIASTIAPDVQVKLHETVLSNYVSPMFAGRTFSNEEISKRISELTGESLKADPDEDPWSITFSSVRPIQFEFDQNAFAVEIFGRRFRQGGNDIRAGLRIRLSFKVKRVGHKLIFARDGNVVIEYAEPEKKNARIVAFKSFLQDRLDSAFTESDQQIELPDNLLPLEQFEALKNSPIAQHMRLIQLRSQQGWLYVGWNYMPGFYQAYNADTPAIWNEIIIEDLTPHYTPQGAGWPQPMLIPSRPVLHVGPGGRFVAPSHQAVGQLPVSQFPMAQPTALPVTGVRSLSPPIPQPTIRQPMQLQMPPPAYYSPGLHSSRNYVPNNNARRRRFRR